MSFNSPSVVIRQGVDEDLQPFMVYNKQRFKLYSYHIYIPIIVGFAIISLVIINPLIGSLIGVGFAIFTLVFGIMNNKSSKTELAKYNLTTNSSSIIFSPIEGMFYRLQGLLFPLIFLLFMFSFIFPEEDTASFDNYSPLPNS